MPERINDDAAQSGRRFPLGMFFAASIDKRVDPQTSPLQMNWQHTAI